MNISPIGLSIKTWCDFNVPLLARYSQVPFLADEEHWQDWAMAVIKNPSVSGFNPPDPRFFNNFYEWAERFNSTVPL